MKRCVFLFLAFIFLCSVMIGCQFKEPLEQTFFVFDTVVNIKIYTGGNDEVMAGLSSLLSRYDALWDPNRENSDLCRLSAAAGEFIEVDKETLGIWNAALPYCFASGGMLDPTIGALTKLWDVKETSAPPAPEDIQYFLSSVNYREVLREGNTMELKSARAKLDFGAIAKGYIADRTAEYLRSEGVASAIIDLGGNILTIGNRPDGKPFQIGIQKPFSDRGSELIGSVPASSLSVVTAGIYERYFEYNGTIYHHILDPKTGYPVQNELASVTILSQSSLAGDALSTICMIEGYEAASKRIESLPDTEAIFVFRDGTVKKTTGAALN